MTPRHRGKIIKTRCMCDRFHRDASCTRNTEVLPKNKTNASDRCRHTFKVDTAVQVHAADFCVVLWMATKALNVYCFHLQGRKWMKYVCVKRFSPRTWPDLVTCMMPVQAVWQVGLAYRHFDHDALCSQIELLA
jgi:hypothetical protein